MIKRTEAVIILFLFFIGTYMIFSIDSVFWNCVYFILIDAFIIYLLIEQLKKPISKSLVWGTIVFTAEHAFIISSLTARDYITYYNTLTNKNIALFLIASIIIVYIVMPFIDKKNGRYGKMDSGNSA